MKKLIQLLLLIAVLVGTGHATQLTGTLNNPDGSGFNGTLYLSITQQSIVSTGNSSTGAACGGPMLVVPTNTIKIAISNGAATWPTVYGSDCMLPTPLPYNAQLRDTSGNILFTTQWIIEGSTQNVGTIYTVPSTIPVNDLVIGPQGPQGIQGIQGPIGAPTSGVNLTPSTSQVVTQPIINGQQTALSISTATVPTWKQTYGVGAFAYPGVNEFGDSITGGNGASIQGMGWTATGYAAIIGRSFGAPVTNYARGGDQAADMAFVQVYPHLNPQSNRQPATTMMIGTNDTLYCGSSTGCQQNYTHALLASVAWAAIPNGNKILFGSNTQVVTTTGTWLVNSGLQPNLALSCETLPCTLSFTTLSPSAVMYLAWQAQDSESTTNASLSCDGGAVTDTLYAYGYSGQKILTHNGVTATVFANRYVFPTNGTHNCTVTVNAITNLFTLTWAASPPLATPNSFDNPSAAEPRVFLGGVIQELNGTNSSIDSIYNGIAQTTANQLAADGLNVAFVDTRDNVNTTTDMSGTSTVLANGTACPGSTLVGVHPNDCGHAHLADAFLSVAQPISAGSSSFGLYNCQNGILCAGDGAAGDASSLIYAAEFAAVNGASYNILTTTDLGMNSTSMIGWGSTSEGSGVDDTAFSRISQGIIAIGNGTPGDYSGSSYAARYAAVNSSENNSLYPNGLGLNDVSPIVWGSTLAGTLSGDTGLSRLAAGELAVGNGTQGDESGGLALSGLITQYITPRLTTAPTGSCSSYTPGTLAPLPTGYFSRCISSVWSTAASGYATLTSGAATISTTAACTASATCVYTLTNCGSNSSTGIGTILYVSAVPGTSFTVGSASATNAGVSTDNSHVCWKIN